MNEGLLLPSIASMQHGVAARAATVIFHMSRNCRCRVPG